MTIQTITYLRNNKHITSSKEGLFYDGKKIRNWVYISIMKVRKDRLIMMGRHIYDDSEIYNCYLRDDNNVLYDLRYTEFVEKAYKREEYENVLIKDRYFEVEIPIDKVCKVEFVAMLKEEISSDNAKECVLSFAYGNHSKLLKNYKNAYYARDGYIVYNRKGALAIERAHFGKELKHEVVFGLELLKRKRKLLTPLLRLALLVYRRLKNREIWIITDRDNAAGDNGEALFKYLQSKERNARVYFAISGKCDDYNRLKTIGKVLTLESVRYRWLFLASDKLLSSQTGEWVTNALGDRRDEYKNFHDFDYYFLQHGIIINDLSSWFRNYHKDLSLFVTSARREYEAVSNYGFNCDKRVVKLTGLPRFDYLENEPQKKIVFLPTWRQGIAGETIPGTAHRNYNEDFKNSDYCKYYNGLINDSRLLDAMEKHGYTGELYIHPAFSVQSVDFAGNGSINVVNDIAKYNRVFKENSLLITDYSSVAFDFAYLKKPVVYTQFDADVFFEEHHCKEGYFDYETDGFGPVANTKEATVDAIIGYIMGGCKMEEKYISRVNSFFEYTDRNNCKRVYEQITKR